MTLGELLTNLRVSVLRDIAAPTLWSDPELTAFLNEAQANFARRTFCLVDDSSPFTAFTTIADQQEYDLDPSIVRVDYAAVVEHDENTGALVNTRELRDGTRHQVPRTHGRGAPRLYTAQTARHRLRLYPVPEAAYQVQMAVCRLPVPLEQPIDECEITEDYQLALCDYAAWRALKNNSPEGAQMMPAADFRAAYDLVVRDAKRDIAALHQGVFPQARGNWTGKSLRIR